MGNCFITRRGGGTSKVYAAIGVSYPEGSTCTCTDGAKTLKLKNTSGQGIFLIPYAATWAVTATDGTNTKSQSVEITSEGQSISVNIVYWDGTIYDSGNEYTAQTGGWTCVTTGGDAAATKTNNQLFVSVSQTSSTAYARTANKISLTGFTKIQATVSAQTHSSSWGGNERCELLVSANADLSAPVA